MGPPFSWQCLPGAPSCNPPSLLQSPGEEAGNKRQREEVQGPGLCPLPQSEHLCAFCVLPPWWGLASLEDRRNVSQLLPHCAGRYPHGYQSSPHHPQPGPQCLSMPHLSQSPLAPACPGIMGTLTTGGSEAPPCCRRHPQARSQGPYEVCYEGRSQAEDTPAPTERAPSESWPHPACTHLIRNACSVQDWDGLSTSTFILFNVSRDVGICSNHPSGLCPLHPVPGVFGPTPLILIGVLTDGSRFPTRGLLPAAPPAPAWVPRLVGTASAISLRSSHFTDVETEPRGGQGACVGCTE